MAEPYRAGLIGCGRISASHLLALGALQRRGALRVVALADPDPQALARRADAAGVPAPGRYADYPEMLARERLDLVAVCTQAPLHGPATVAAAAAGVRGVLCEKPLALDLEEADRMIDACTAAGTVLAVNHPLRFLPAAHRARELVRAGAIGEPLALRLHDKGGRPAGVALMEVATHFFDLAGYLAGEPWWVSAHLTTLEGTGSRLSAVEDIRPSRLAWPRDRDCGLVLGDRCAATFGFRPDAAGGAGAARGLTATYQALFQPPGKTWRSGLEILGLEGALSLNSAGDGALELRRHRGPWETPGRFEPVPLDAAAAGAPDGAGPAPPVGSDGVVFVASIVAGLTELLARIEDGGPHASGGREGRQALEMIMGVYESHRHGGARVELPLAAREHPLVRWRREAQPAG